jgi:predicted DNA-binding transcriptional regulator AlpA
VSERLLTARELGELLGLSTATVLDRFERGDLPGFRFFGRKGGPVRFRLSEILEALDGSRVMVRSRGWLTDPPLRRFSQTHIADETVQLGNQSLPGVARLGHS